MSDTAMNVWCGLMLVISLIDVFRQRRATKAFRDGYELALDHARFVIRDREDRERIKKLSKEGW